MWRSGIKTQLLDLVGEGSQGRVFKALRIDRQTRLTQTVAIKILHSKTAVEMWRKEFHSLQGVRSAYCVQVLGHERVAGQPALVMEYINGLSLAEIGRIGLLTPADIHEVVAQIEAGLNDLRSHKICHGDLSPANVMVDCTGRVRLLDFGLANQIRATVEFSAPERLAGHPATYAADLFALGRIEEFLGQPQSTKNGGSNYLRLEPGNRKPRGKPAQAERQASLGSKISAYLKRQQGVAPTQTLVEAATPTRLPRRFRLAAIGATCAFLGSGRATPPPVQPTGHLQVITREWYSVSLDGRPIGYTPIDLVLSTGRHELKYTSGRGQGKRSITIFSGKPLKLSDRDLTRFE